MCKINTIKSIKNQNVTTERVLPGILQATLKYLKMNTYLKLSVIGFVSYIVLTI